MAINFPTALDSFATKTAHVDYMTAAMVNDINDCIEALEAKVGIDSSAVEASLDYKVNNFIAAGRSLWLYENTAPTGWTYQSSVEDCVLSCKGGTEDYNDDGGLMGGSWTQPDCTLTAAQMAHNHQFYNFVSGDVDGQSYDIDGGAIDLSIGDQSGGSAIVQPGTTYGTLINSGVQIDLFTDGINESGADYVARTAHNHGTAYRPTAALGIIVEKD